MTNYMTITITQINNFWKKVIKTDSCWNWSGYKTSKGYGLFKVNGVQFLTHRFSLMLENKLPIAKKSERGALGICVLHSCDNPSCVNPKHLRLGTHLENMQDARQRGRKWRGEFTGEKNKRSTISDAKAREIKRLLKLKILQKDISSQMNVPHYIISNIAVGRSWTHV